MKPITISLVLPLADDVEPPLAPLMLELHASSSPPPPTTAAPAPAARSRPRRLRGALLAGGATPPDPPVTGGMPSPLAPQTPLAVLSGCAVWSLMCNRSPFEVAPGAGPRLS